MHRGHARALRKFHRVYLLEGITAPHETLIKTDRDLRWASFWASMLALETLNPKIWVLPPLSNSWIIILIWLYK